MSKAEETFVRKQVENDIETGRQESDELTDSDEDDVALTKLARPKLIFHDNTYVSTNSYLDNQRDHLLWIPPPSSERFSWKYFRGLPIWAKICNVFNRNSSSNAPHENDPSIVSTRNTHDDQEKASTTDLSGSSIIEVKEDGAKPQDATSEPSNHEFRLALRLERERLSSSANSQSLPTPEITPTNRSTYDESNDFQNTLSQQWNEISALPSHLLHDINRLHQHEDTTPSTLAVKVQTIRFDDHGMFNEEERWSRHLYLLYNRLCQTDEARDQHYCKLKEALKQIRLMGEGDDVNREQTCFLETVDKLCKDLLQEEKESSSLYHSILETWASISKVREMQKFRCSEILLVKKWNKCHGAGGQNDLLLSECRKALKLLQQHLCYADAKHDRSEQDSSRAKAETKLLTILTAVEMLQVLKEKEPSFGLHLSKYESSCSNAIPDKEWNRRQVVQKEQYFVKLLVNGLAVGKTKPVRLDWPSFAIDFNTDFTCHLASRTCTVNCQLWHRRSLRPDNFVCDIYLHTPGLKDEKDATPIEMPASSTLWYQFQFADSTATQYKKASALISIQWENHSDLSDLFTPPFTSQSKSIIYEFSNGSRIIRPTVKEGSKPPLNNASANTSINDVDVLNERSMAFRVKGFSQCSFLNYWKVKEPARHLLMKQRNLDPSKSMAPIPLKENELGEKISYEARKSRKGYLGEELLVSISKERPLVDRKHIRKTLDIINQCKRANSRRKVRRVFSHSDVVRDLSEMARDTSNFDFLWNMLWPKRPFGALDPLGISTLEDNNPRRQRLNLVLTIVGASNLPFRMKSYDSKATGRASVSVSSNRVTRDSNSLNDELMPENISAPILNTYVEILFHGKRYKTRIDAGQYPLWKQTFKMPLNDLVTSTSLSPLHLMSRNDPIEVLVYDSVRVDIGNMGGYYDDEDTIVSEKRFLGEVTVPINSLYDEGRIRGSFLLNTPDMIMGYCLHGQKSSHGRNEGSFIQASNGGDNSKELPTLAMVEYTEPRRNYTSLRMALSLDPLLRVSSDHAIALAGTEAEIDEQALLASEWQKALEARSPSLSKRHLRLIYTSSHGCCATINRFLRSQAPPENIDSMGKCAHFVSLIPFPCKSLSVGAADMIWWSSQHFLNALSGGWNEHASLLANYFLYLREKYTEMHHLEVFLVVGDSISEGKVVYVMTLSKHEKECYIWNPSNGHRFLSSDEICPLKNIYCLVSPKNIYANIQPNSTPALMRFDVDDETAWGRLHNSNEIQKQSIQDSLLRYSSPDIHIALELEMELVDAIKSAIRGWRRIPSTFNGDIGNRLRPLLDILENNKLSPSTQTETSLYHQRLLNEIGVGKSIFGIPLHSGFTNVNEVVERIRKTGIHICKHAKVEFALAVRVFPYACNIFSVWVFVCIIYPQ